MATKRHSIRLIIFIVILIVVISAVLYILFWPAKKSTAPAATPTPPPKTSSSVETKLSQLSLHDKVARLLVIHQTGTDQTVLQQFVNSYQPGGFILMGDNIPSSSAAMQSISTALRGNDTAFPRLVAIDEEGGSVKRLKGDTFASAKTLKNLPVADTTEAFTSRSNELQNLGITLNFGIIADTTQDPNSFIYDRVLGTTPTAASERVAAAVKASQGKTLTTLKHFPGHGETEDNSHLSIPTITVSLADWQTRDKPSFQAGISAGADVVMMGHLRYTAVDDTPASLSKKWHDILRHELSFKGIIITDDMFMLQDSGEPAYENLTKNAVSALQAGNTMLLYVTNHENANTMIDPASLINAIVAAVKSGQLSETTIDADVTQVLTAEEKTAQF